MPSGRVIQISIEQYLAMTDEDFQMLEAGNFGDYINSPWHGSAIKGPSKKDKLEHDADIDYDPEYDEKHVEYLEEDCSDEFPDIPDDMIDVE